jgi:hypothetical protein
VIGGASKNVLERFWSGSSGVICPAVRLPKNRTSVMPPASTCSMLNLQSPQQQGQSRAVTTTQGFPFPDPEETHAPEGLTGIHLAIHCAATSDEAKQLQVNAFLDALPEMALSVAKRNTESEGSVA